MCLGKFTMLKKKTSQTETANTPRIHNYIDRSLYPWIFSVLWDIIIGELLRCLSPYPNLCSLRDSHAYSLPIKIALR